MKLKIDFITKSVLLVLLLACSNFVLAQRTITGTVIDSEENEPLIGATVTVLGTGTGTITDFDGKYSLEVPDDAKFLEFSYTGYSNQKIELGASNVVDISMSPGTVLDEVVVVGYGSVKKSDATGAVTSVTAEDFNQGVVASPEQLIQGRAAGVQITTASGEPGAGINIRIRGTSSVRSGNNPLFVVDGVPLSGDNTSASGNNGGLGASSARNPLNFLNPADIASIDILKDASATAIYGSRGANGVVIITTKSGAKGKSVLDYGYSLGISTISKRYDLLGRDEFLAAYASFNGQAAADGLDGGADTDWQDETFRTAITHNHNLSYGGGDDRGDFRFSLSYQDQEGIVQNSGLQRLSGRFNGTRKFWDDKLRITTQFTVSNINDDNVPITDDAGFEGDLIGNILKANPTTPVRDSDGELVQPGITEPNPVALLELSESFTNTLRALGNIGAEISLTENLSFKTVVGFDRSFSDRVDAFSRDLAAPNILGVGRLYLSDVNVSNRLWENYFTYNQDFGNISFNGVAGYSYQQFKFTSEDSQYADFRTSDLNEMIFNLSSSQIAAGTNSSRNINELQSFFTRLQFGIQSKYLFTLTLRADGSTRFGSDNRYGYFPSAAFKWRLIEESFVPELFSDLGLRLGYGITGNQEIPHNLYTSRQRFNDNAINNGGDQVDPGGLDNVAFENPGLKWESTSQLNVGLDFAFLNYRLSGSLDYYYKNTNDLLIRIDAAQPAPAPFQWDNLDADVINTGVELGLNFVVVDKSNFQWDVNGNVSYNKNEVRNFKGLINTGDIDGQGLTGAFAQRIADGQPLFAYFLREFGGYDDNGISVYPNGDFQEFVGSSPLPTWNAGLTNTFRYGNFDLSIFFSGQFGFSIYSNTANAFFTAGSLANGRNVTADIVNNGEGNLNAPDVSTRFLEKGDFVRLQNVSLGYNVKLNSDKVSSLRFFVTGQNLALFTGYSGQDPEVNVNKAINDVPSLGIDYTPYPRSRIFTLGANVSF